MVSILKKIFNLLFHSKYSNYISIGLCAVLFLIVIHLLGNGGKNKSVVNDNTEYIDSNKTYHNINNDKPFKDLKKENKALYDSLKSYKTQINYLVQFKYKKTYNTGKVIVSNAESNNIPSKTYEYSNNDNDTLHYSLQINSSKEPNWYRMNISVSDKFTVINKKNGQNETTVQAQNKGNISDVIVLNKKEKQSFLKRFNIGPTVAIGYDPFKKDVGMTIGVGISFNILK